jgi:hypothetical protein
MGLPPPAKIEKLKTPPAPQTVKPPKKEGNSDG